MISVSDGMADYSERGSAYTYSLTGRVDVSLCAFNRGQEEQQGNKVMSSLFLRFPMGFSYTECFGETLPI